MMRAAFTSGTASKTFVTVSTRPGSHLWLIFSCNGDELERQSRMAPLNISQGEWKDMIPESLTIAFGQGERDVAVEAAILAMQGQEQAGARRPSRKAHPACARRPTWGSCAFP